MADLLKLPFYDSDMARIRWGDLKLEGAPQWQQYPVILEPLEKVTIQLSGRLVWYHRTWTTSGSCGKTKHHVDHREAGPDEQPCRFVIQDSKTHAFVYQFEGEVRETQKSYDIPEDLPGRGQLRLTGALIESLNGGGGDNSGAYNLQVSVDSEERITRFINSLTDMNKQLADSNAKLSTNGFYDSVLKWFPRRLPLYAAKHNEFLNLLVEMAEAILVHRKDESWFNVAAWLVEWSVTPSAGGKESFADGWLCRGKIASHQNNATAAIKYFAAAFKKTSEKDVVLYEYAKMLEFSGKLFSDSNLNVNQTSIFEAISKESAESKLSIGAYEVYQLALNLRNKATTPETIAVADNVLSRELTPEDYIKSYDIHYAIARLAFLNHTTESLKKATEHLRICRRLAPFRYFTTPALYGHYTLEMLLYDTLKTQRNPFYHDGDSSDKNKPIGLKGLKLQLDSWLSIDSDSLDKPLGGSSKSTLTTGNNWLAINNHTAYERHVFNSVVENNQATKLFRKSLEVIEEHQSEKIYGEMNNINVDSLEGSFVDVAFDQSIAQAIRNQAQSIESAFANNQQRDSKEHLFNREPRRFDILQNPSLILTTFLKTCLVNAESCYYEKEFVREEMSSNQLAKELFAFEAFKLVSQTPTNDGFSLRFKHKEYEYDCVAKLVKGRLQLSNFQIKTPNHTIAAVTIKYIDDCKMQQVKLSKRLVSGVNQSEEQQITLDHIACPEFTTLEENIELDNPHYELTLHYADNLVSKIDYNNAAAGLLLQSKAPINLKARINLSYVFTHQDSDPDSDSDSDSDKYSDCLLTNHPSLQSAYIPFKDNINETCFRKAESKDLIWLYKQFGATRAIKEHILLEIGRRLIQNAHHENQLDVDNINFVFVYDIMLGQYLSTSQSSQSEVSRPIYQGMAASCLLNLVEVTGKTDSKLGLTKTAALKSLLQVVSRLNTPKPNFKSQSKEAIELEAMRHTLVKDTLNAINKFVFTFQEPPLPWLVQDDKEQHIKTLAERLTIQWLRLVSTNMDDLEISKQLVSPILGSGLSRFAFHWLFNESNNLPSEESNHVKIWLENEAILDAPSDVTQGNSVLTGYLASAQTILSEQDDTEGSIAQHLRTKLGLANDAQTEYITLKVLEKFCRSASLNQVRVTSREMNLCLSLMTTLTRKEYERLQEAAQFVLEMVRVVSGIQDADLPLNTLEALKSKLDASYAFQLAKLDIEGIEEAVATKIDPLVASIFPTVSPDNKLNTKLEVSESPLVPNRDYMGISPIEYKDVDQQQWELRLHDEPFSDEIAALIALSDRHLARKNNNHARKYLLKAQEVMVKLDQESPTLISEADAAQLPYWRNRIKVKLTWLDQGKDAYGRFITSAPPRRLGSILGSFTNDVQKLRTYTQLSQKDAEKQINRAKSSVTIKRELKSNEFDEKQARLEVEKNQRTIAFLQKSLSGLSGRRQELERQTNEALEQYNKGKQQSAAAVESLGKLVAQAVVSSAPIIGNYANLSTDTTKNIITALDAVSKVQKGEDPLKVAVQSFGTDLIDMTFSSVEPKVLFGVDITNVVQGGAEELVTTGSLNFDKLAKGTMRQMGEHLFNEHARTLANELDDYIENAQVDVKDLEKEWRNLESTVRSKLHENLEFKKLDEIRKFVDETVLSSKGRKDILQKTVNALKDMGEKILEGALLDLNNSDFPIETVIDLYQNNAKIDGLLNLTEGALQREFERVKKQLSGKELAKINSVTQSFNENIQSLLTDADKLKKCVIKGANNEAYEALNMVCEVISTSCESIDLEAQDLHQIQTLRNQCLKLIGGTKGSSSLINTLKLVPFPRARFNQLTLDQSSLPALKLVTDNNLSYEDYLTKLFDALLVKQLSTPEELKEAFDILNSAMSIFAEEVLLLEESAQSVGETLKEDFKDLVDSFEPRWNKFVNLTGPNIAANETKAFKSYVSALLSRNRNLVLQVLKEGHSVLNEVESWKDVISEPERIFGDSPSEVLTLLEQVIEAPKGKQNGLIQMVLNNLVSHDKVESQLTNDVVITPFEAMNKDALKSYVQLKSGAFLLKSADENELLKLKPETIKAIENKAKQTQMALGNNNSKQNKIEVITPQTLKVNKLTDSDEDFIAYTLSNPGIQAALTTLSMAYPMAGLAVQGVIAINNWLSGEADRKLGAKAIEKAQGQMRKLDKEVSETRHQRELVLIEQINAKDNVERIKQDRLLLREAEDLDFEAANQSILMRRYNYRRLWVTLDLINYKLYILQKAFEYEYDVAIERLAEKHPEYSKFQSLFEISPGTLAGEFNRSNVLSDMLPALDGLTSLKEAIETYEDLAKDTKYRDSLTFSLKNDFPEVWEMFKKQSDTLSPLNFKTTLLHFSGVMMQGKSIRHSYKIERVSLTPELNSKLYQRSIENMDRFNSTLERAETMATIRSPKAMLKNLDAELQLLQRREFSLISQDISRFKTALFHSGVGPQVNEDGKLRILEWGPQVSDSNLEVVDSKSNYNFAEGLTPATDWTIAFDSSSTLTPEHLSDIKLTIQFTYCRHEENARHFHLYLNEESGLRNPQYVLDDTDEADNTHQQSAILSKINAKFRNKRLH